MKNKIKGQPIANRPELAQLKTTFRYQPTHERFEMKLLLCLNTDHS